MKKLFFIFAIFVLLIPSSFSQSIEYSLSISIPDSEIVYLINLKNLESITIQSVNELKSIEVNSTKIKPVTLKHGTTFVYKVLLDKNSESRIKINCKYDISKDILKNGFVVLSEVMRTLPYLEEIKNPSIRVSIILGDSDYKVFSRGESYVGKIITFNKNHGDPIVIGYYSLLTLNYKNKKLNSIVPIGMDSLGADILSWTLVGVENVEKDLFELPYKELNIIYYLNALFSETINNTIILSKIESTSFDYFSDIERVEAILTIIHELLHIPIGENIDDNFIDTIEGFIQFVAIEEIGKIFGEELKSKIYKNYMLQLRYLSLSDYDNKILIRYRKYPLVFRYLFFLVGEVNYISLYKYLSSNNRFIDDFLFWNTFKNLTGISGESYKPLFDNTPTLWNISITIDSDTLFVNSTAPININVELNIMYEDSADLITVEIQPNQIFKYPLPKKPIRVAINENFYFPEFFINDNYIKREIHPVVKDFVDLLSYTLNTKDLSRIKKGNILPSKNLFSKLENYTINKEKFFGNYELRFLIEDVYRYGNNIIVELTIIYGGGIKFKVCLLTISYGKSYYIKDFSIF